MTKPRNCTIRRHRGLFAEYRNIIFRYGENARYMSKEHLYELAGKKFEYSAEYAARLIKDMIKNGIPQYED